MQLVLYSWNGHLINDTTNFNAYIPVGQRPKLKSNPTFVTRANAFAFLSGSVLPGHDITITVMCRGDLNVGRDTIDSWFNVADQTPRQLIAQDPTNSNKQWYVTAIPQNVSISKIGIIDVTLALSDPIWRPVVSSTDTWNVTASGQTHVVPSVLGTLNAKPVITLTPTSSRTGQFAYKVWCPIHNQTNEVFQFYPYDVTQGGLNTSALVTGGKMQSSGNDFIVQVDGAIIDRWLDAMNTTSTKCWINLSLSSKQQATLGTTISNVGGVSTIQLVVQDTSYNFLFNIQNANNKVVLIDSEAFTFTDVDLVNYQLTGCVRAQKGTTAATHTASATEAVNWIEHDVWVLYGNSTYPGPQVNTTKQPLIDLHNSTNSSWVWSQFRDAQYSRPGEWRPTTPTTLGGQSGTFTANQNTNANPATEMGCALRDFQTQNVWKAETATIQWAFTSPAGITNVSVSGSKMSTGTYWPTLAGLQYGQFIVVTQTFQQEQTIGGKKHPGRARWATVTTTTTVNTLVTLWNEGVPATPNVWSTFSHAGVALPSSQHQIQVILSGSIPADTSGAAYIQFDTVTCTLDTTGTPSGTYNAEQSTYYINCQILNQTTGDSIFLAYPIGLSPSNVVIDCEQKLVTASDGANAIQGFSTSSVRPSWLDFLPGTNANTLQFIDVGTGNVTIGLSWKDKTY